MKKITYYASNDTMGDTSGENCELFREWAAKQLEAKYPEYKIVVLDENTTGSSSAVYGVEDYEKISEITDFCSRLWDSCPWDASMGFTE